MKKLIPLFSVFMLFIFVGCSISCQNTNGLIRKVSVSNKLNIGSCMDAVVNGDILFVIGSKTIYSYNISSPKNPVLLYKLSGLGNVRQIEVEEGYAYVTAREEGLFIIDISNPSKLRKVAHYDTLELGTGIAVFGDIAAVTNRQYGVEFLDVSNKGKPVFLSKIITGEAQSVFLKDSLAIVGDWGTKEVVLVNISNIYDPKIISRVELDGYGDGVFVKDNYCFAATGHHARGWKKNSTDSTYWGKGHGMEIIDISDPLQPVKISVLKFPVQYYQLYADMWDVQVSGNYAFVGDSEAGLFIVDVRDKRNPVIVGNASIPVPDMPEHMLSYFKEGEKSGAIGGFAIGENVVYLAGIMNDLYVSEANEATKPALGNATKMKLTMMKESVPKSNSSYFTNSQVHSAYVYKHGSKALIAAGDGGVHEVSLSPQIKGKQLINTGTIVFDVFLQNELMYLAEGIDGFSIWEWNKNDKPQFFNRYTSENGGVYQFLIEPDKNLAILHVGANHLEILDIKNNDEIKRLTDFKPYSGLMYRFPIARGFLKDRFVACSWHTTGCYFYDLKCRDQVKFLGNFIPPLGVINGAAFINDKVVAVSQGGYIVQNAPDKEQLTTEEVTIIDSLYLKGKPVIFNSNMYVSNRMKGNIFSIDISDLETPKENWQLKIDGNPGLITEVGDMLIVPAGHQGLLLLNKENGECFYQ